MIPIGIEIIGLPQVFTRFDKIERGIDNLRPLWDKFGPEFYSQETAHFTAAPFAALTPRYARRKREIYGNKPILQATGALLKSFTQPDAKGSIRRVNNLSAEFGSRDPKAMFHHFGTSRMPIRDPLVKPDEEKYQTLAGRYLAELVGAK